MLRLFILILALVPTLTVAQEGPQKGWTVLKGTVATVGPFAPSLDKLDDLKLTFHISKAGERLSGLGERLNGLGEPKLSVLCNAGAVGVLVTDPDLAEGPARRVQAGVSFDGEALHVTQWILLGNTYQPTDEQENKELPARFLTSRQLSLVLPTGPSDSELLRFDLEGFEEAATEMRKSCPF
jgi:hypothetical protein